MHVICQAYYSLKEQATGGFPWLATKACPSLVRGRGERGFVRVGKKQRITRGAELWPKNEQGAE